MPSAITQKRGPEGLGGWLILVGIAVVASPFRIALDAVMTFQPIFSDGTWTTLTDPTDATYNPLWKVIILGEIATNILMGLAWLYAAYLFFTKQPLFPLWFRSLLIISFMVILADAFLIMFIQPTAQVFDTDTVKNLARSIVAIAVWVPYTLLSKRVRNTFVDHKRRAEAAQAVFE